MRGLTFNPVALQRQARDMLTRAARKLAGNRQSGGYVGKEGRHSRGEVRRNTLSIDR